MKGLGAFGIVINGSVIYNDEKDRGVKRREDDFIHTEKLVIIDTNKHLRDVYNSINKASVKQLKKDIKALSLEK